MLVPMPSVAMLLCLALRCPYGPLKKKPPGEGAYEKIWEVRELCGNLGARGNLRSKSTMMCLLFDPMFPCACI